MKSKYKTIRVYKTQKQKYIPRIIFSVSKEQLNRSQILFTRDGPRGIALSKFFDLLLDLVQERGEIAAAELGYGNFKQNLKNFIS